MPLLTDFISYKDAHEQFSKDRLWDLFDGDQQNFNMTHECVDRHAGSGKVAVRIAHEKSDEDISYRDISIWSGRFANWLIGKGLKKGDRVGVMLPPSLAFYVSVFGAIKAGGIAVPLFTLFGSEGLRLRVDDCTPAFLVTNAEKKSITEGMNTHVVIADDDFFSELARFPEKFEVTTTPDDMAIYQYTSGTAKAMPTAVKHTHRSLTLMMAAALYGSGIRPGDRMFCPSSIAWGHGLWHGTLAPFVLGMTTGTFGGKFDPERFCQVLQDYNVNVVTAAATHYRMMKNSGVAENYKYKINKASFTGEPIDQATREFVEKLFGTPICSMYGTTEVGTILLCYPGAPDFEVRPGCLGKPAPGLKIEVHKPDGSVCRPREVGEIVVLRRDKWLPTKDLGFVDEDGYFFFGGRADDVIISAGWTMSALEIENVLLMHPDVTEAAVIGAADDERGQVPKAFVVSDRAASEAFAKELQDFTKNKLSLHEYPRRIAFVNELPKTPAGKINRKVLRERELAA